MLKAKKKEIPVYVFVGFLEAGKTDFMQGVLEGNDFCRGERTLLLVCEEGENEYNPKKFSAPNIFIEKLFSALPAAGDPPKRIFGKSSHKQRPVMLSSERKCRKSSHKAREKVRK